MEKKTNRLGFPGMTPEKLQFGCLAAVGIMELLLVAFGPMQFWLSSFIGEHYLVIPGILFLGAALMSWQTPLARRSLLAGVVGVAWLMIAQSAQRMAWQEPNNISMLWTVYLLAFPFASVSKQREKGLKFMVAVTMAIAVVFTVYAALMELNLLPSSEQFHWDGTRMWALWHPNITACIFMMSIAFSLGCCFLVKKRWQKMMLLAGAATQFLAQVITNCRTSIVMTCALAAGVVFFWIFRRGWKQFLLGGLAAIAVFGGLIFLSDGIYEAHGKMVTARYIAQQQAPTPDAAAPETVSPETVSSETSVSDVPVQETTEPLPQVSIPTQNGQRSFWADLGTLNGRTGTWRRALRAVWWQPELLVRGSADVGETISAVDPGGFQPEHAHNSWMQMLVGFGLPGLLLALYITFLALRGAIFLLLRTASEMWKKCVALLVLCLLMAGFLEPFLFAEYYGYYHFINLMFFLCTGYVDLWREEVVHPERAC